MYQRRQRGRGWVPDLPDHRDKRYRRAQQKLARSARSRPKSDVPHTFDGWKKSKEGMIRQVEAARRDGDREFENKLKTALMEAFPAEGAAIKAGRILSPLSEEPPAQLPTRVDLRPFMSPIENQEEIGSCTAHAVIALAEYLQIATTASYVDAARLFLYKATRNLLQWTGDTGAYLRETIKALRLFGVCPEPYWPYDPERFDDEPPGFCYAYASNYQAMRYYRLDDLEDIWRSLAQGHPVAFGFTCYESMDSAENYESGRIPYPGRYEQSTGGHAVLAVGYYDRGYNLEDEPNEKDDGDGYLIIRNSWGAEWGQDGYGFLPYRYIQGHGDREDIYDPLSEDYWTMTRMELPDLADTRVAPFLLENRGGV